MGHRTERDICFRYDSCVDCGRPATVVYSERLSPDLMREMKGADIRDVLEQATEAQDLIIPLTEWLTSKNSEDFLYLKSWVSECLEYARLYKRAEVVIYWAMRQGVLDRQYKL